MEKHLKQMNILNEATKMIKNIFKKQYNCLGYLIDNDELFLFSPLAQ